MENYDRFVQRRLSCLRKSEEEHNKPSPPSSLIRFHGHPILPPLLSGEQREEMQRHRDAAQKAAVHKKVKNNARMAYVQTMLQSVELRKTPTLEELLQESDVITKSSYSHNSSSGSVPQSSCFAGTKDSVLLSPLPDKKEKDGIPHPPLTSTTYSAFFASSVTPQQSYHDGCLIDRHYSQEGPQPSFLNGASHQSVSSGYVTYENVENTTGVSGGFDAGREGCSFGTLEGVSATGGFFLHNTSNTIAKMPDIISHPPIDGEELERSGLELSFCNDFLEVKDISCSSVQADSVKSHHFPDFPEESSESSHVDSLVGKDNLPVTTEVELVKDHSLDITEELISSSDNSGLSENHHCLTAELHVQHGPTETEPADNHVDEAEMSEEPYRLSLQALLKKSQEYRRRQRLLRNQAKNTKNQERAQEQARARTEEQSLSDKENDEFLYKGTVTAEGKKTKERRGTFIPSAEMPPKKSWEDERMNESELFGRKENFESEGTDLTEGDKTREMTSAEEETTFKNNRLNISQELITESKHISTVPQQQPTSTESSHIQEAFYLTTCPADFHKGVGKYHTVPAPNFCRSPIRSKSKGGIQDGGVTVEAETSKQKVSATTGLNKEVDTALPSTVNLIIEGDITRASARSSQHIAQLESNLSGLKVLISDLESTLTENLGNHSQTGSRTQSELSFESVKQSEQIKKDVQLHQSDCEYLGDKLREDDRSNERRQSVDIYKNVHENTGSEPSISDTDDAPHVVQVKETEAVNVNELRLVKTLATERAKEKGSHKEGLTKSYGQHSSCRKQQPPAKCVLSVTQRLRIPNVFRNDPPETKVQLNASVLSDTSNQLVERKNETSVERHDSTHLPSLNQSYDVDAPSGLWFLEGSGSDSGSRGDLVLEKHLTPESGGEDQGGVSKVKRRLLMHETESRGASPSIRPNSSTPRAAVRWQEVHGSQKDKQEQLKQAHAAQVRALQEEHKRQQEELLQALAMRYRLLQSVSFPCSVSGSRLGDTLTFSTLSQPSSPLSEHYRPLLSAAVKGFLTRRLLKTEKVAQLVRTIRDTRQFLQALQQQSPGRGEFSSRQDLLLQERVTLQLRAAHYEVYDIFFSLSAGERMQLIGWDRELARERELRRQSGHTSNPRGKSSLSAATQKALERKRGIMIQKKAAGRHRGAVTKTGHNTGSSAERLPETKRGQFRANPQRVPKSTYSSRPR